MMIWILLFIDVLLCVVFLITALTAAHPNKNIILATTLPLERLSEPEVKAIAKRFVKTSYLLISLFFILFLPILFLQDYVSLMILYCVIWVVFLVTSVNSVLNKYTATLRSLKQKEKWFVGEVHTINIDTEVSRLKDKMPVSRWWFLPSFVLAALPCLWAVTHPSQIDLIPSWMSLLSFVFPAIALWMYHLYTKRRTEVISDNSDVNIACNYFYRRMWSVCCVVLALVGSLTSTVSFLFAYQAYPNVTSFPFLFPLGPVCILGIILFTYFRVRDTQNRLLTATHTPLLSDDDIFWKHGFYCNPNDPRTTVEKRIGIGFTVNMATTKGKWSVYGSLIGAALLVCFLIGMLFLFDTAQFTLTEENNTYSIGAPLYSYSFDKTDIKKVTMLQELPQRTRTYGAESNTYAIGDFNVSGFGRSKVYVYPEYSPIVVIELSDCTVFLNSKNPEITQQYYELVALS